MMRLNRVLAHLHASCSSYSSPSSGVRTTSCHLEVPFASSSSRLECFCELPVLPNPSSCSRLFPPTLHSFGAPSGQAAEGMGGVTPHPKSTSCTAVRTAMTARHRRPTTGSLPYYSSHTNTAKHSSMPSSSSSSSRTTTTTSTTIQHTHTQPQALNTTLRTFASTRPLSSGSASFEYRSPHSSSTSNPPLPAPSTDPFACLSPDASAAWNKDLIVEHYKSNGLVHLHLNRPKALNALSLDMVLCISEYLSQLQRDERCNLVLVSGEGEKAFCAGGDVRALSGGDAKIVQRFFSREYLMDFRTATITKPYISVLKGIVMGGGCGISLHGRYRVVTDNSVLAMPETSIGLIPDVGATYVLPRLSRGVGLYLGLTGERLNACDAVKQGLATHFVARERLDELLQTLKESSFGDKTDIDQSHRVVSEILSQYRSEAESRLQPNLNNEVLDRIEEVFHNAETLQEVLAKLKAKAPTDDFCQRTLKTIQSKCPLSCAVWFRQYRQGAQLSLADALRLEFRLVQSFTLFDPNFKEGVRAVLVDKDGAPNWSPKTIEEVPDSLVDDIFRCVEGEPLDAFVQLSI